MKVIKSVRFGIERSEELVRVIDQLVLLVNWCIQKCLENEVTSRAALHKVAYQDFKNEFDLAKYSRREKNRVNQKLHEISKTIDNSNVINLSRSDDSHGRPYKHQG